MDRLSAEQPPGDGLPQAGERLPHLRGEAAPVRQVIAAHALAGLAHVVEIGGAGLPLTGFLHHRPASITVIDPKIAPWESAWHNGHPCRVRHLSRKLVDADRSLLREGLGVALLGLSLKPFGRHPAVGEALVALCRGAERVVIEHALELERATDQLPDLVAAAGLVELWGVDLVLRDPVIGNLSHSRRRLSVMRAKAAR